MRFNDELKKKLIEFISLKFNGIKISSSKVIKLYRRIFKNGVWIWGQVGVGVRYESVMACS